MLSGLCSRAFLFLNSLLQIVEFAVPRAALNPASASPTVFIIGVPRSGTTLAYQTFSGLENVQALTNRHCRLYGAPFLASVRSVSAELKVSEMYSEYGRTFGLESPSECGSWWQRFFPAPNEIVGPDNANRRQMRAFAKSLLLMGRRSGRILLVKNVYASLRIRAIDLWVPRSLFILVTRNEADIRRSLLEARKVHGGLTTWFSVKPPGIDEPALLTPEDQVTFQIRRVLEVIEDSIRDCNIESSRVLRIAYETLKNHPDSAVRDFEKFLLKNS